MDTRPAISVIIPVYNVEKWIRRAVESLQRQTFGDYELFLVDDGSSDSSGGVCDDLARGDGRIVVVHRENGGAASARNEAMALARGDYLYFMDGDDWCEPTMLEDLHALAVRHDLDLVVTGFYIDTYYGEGKYYRESRNAPDCVFSSRQEFREQAHALFDAQLLYAPWNKLYRRAYLEEHGIRFPATFWDDLPFNLDVVRDVERVGCLDGHYYHFLRARAESENTKYRSDMYAKREEEHEWLQELYRELGARLSRDPRVSGPALRGAPRGMRRERDQQELHAFPRREARRGRAHGGDAPGEKGAFRGAPPLGPHEGDPCALPVGQRPPGPGGKLVHIVGEADERQRLRPPEGEPLMSGFREGEKAAPFLSVVMPCYNVAAFLEEALESVLAQDGCPPFEVVLVEDASPDGATAPLCRALAAARAGVRCCEHAENKGLSAARNTGLSAARGEYVLFMDADDRLDPGLFGALWESVQEHAPDMVVFGAKEDYYTEAGELSYSRDVTAAPCVCSSPEDIAREALALEKGTLLGYAWNKLYRRTFLLEHGLSFPDVGLVEDILFNVEAVRHAGVLVVLEGPYYRYARRLGAQKSLTARYLPHYFEQNSLRVEAMCDLCRESGIYDAEARGVLGAIYARYALSALWRNRDPRAGLSRKERAEWLDAFFEFPLSRELVLAARPEGAFAKASAFLFRHRAKRLLLAEAAVVDFANRHVSSLFTRARQSR